MIAGATAQTYTATESGTYNIAVTDGSCTLTSQSKTVVINPAPTPAIIGDASNVCPATSVALSTGAFSDFQWQRNGVQIPGATSSNHTATLSGTYTVTVADADGCEGTAADHDVEVRFCSTTEVSPHGAIYPARVVKDSLSSTGYTLYFQSISGGRGYNVYEGTIGSWYSHANAPGNVCNVTAVDLGTGELRAEILPSAGNHYYLVTAKDRTVEGPSGFASSGAQIDPAQSTCTP